MGQMFKQVNLETKKGMASWSPRDFGSGLEST